MLRKWLSKVAFSDLVCLNLSVWRLANRDFTRLVQLSPQVSPKLPPRRPTFPRYSFIITTASKLRVARVHRFDFILLSTVTSTPWKQRLANEHWNKRKWTEENPRVFSSPFLGSVSRILFLSCRENSISRTFSAMLSQSRTSLRILALCVSHLIWDALWTLLLPGWIFVVFISIRVSSEACVHTRVRLSNLYTTGCHLTLRTREC